MTVKEGEIVAVLGANGRRQNHVAKDRLRSARLPQRAGIFQGQ